MPWLKTGATQYHVQLGHPDKGRAIKGSWLSAIIGIYRAFGPCTKRSGPTGCLSTVP